MYDEADAVIEPIQHDTPNRGALRAPEDVTLCIVHYTGSLSLAGTLAWFGDPAARVSAHYVIGRGGEIHTFGGPARVLWHAGRSEWQGRRGCNAYSVGVEFVGTYGSGFTVEQYAACAEVVAACMEVCPIRAVVGHEHVSPGRKVDPGQKFRWQILSQELAPRLPPGRTLDWLGGQPTSPPVSRERMEPGIDDEDAPGPAQAAAPAASAAVAGPGVLAGLWRALGALWGRLRRE